MAAVAIIMPVLNGERYLPDAIASVQRQTFTDWELLVVDDGSTDGSRDIAERAAAADSRIVVVPPSPEHKGAGAARNRGLAAATAEFIAFLDADDLYHEDKLAFEVAILERYPTAAMTYGPTFWWFEDAPEQSWTESLRGFAGRLHAPPDLLRRVILNQESQVPCTCAVLIRRAALDVVGGFWESVSLYEDQSIWVKIMNRYPVYVHDRVLCTYRQHPYSASAHAQAQGEYDRMAPHPARIDFLEWIESEAGIARSAPLQQSLRIAFASYPAHRRPLTVGDRLVMLKRETVARAKRLPGRLVRRLRLATRKA